MHTAQNIRRGTHEKRIDSRPVSAATRCFGTTPPDPCGSRRWRRPAPRQGSLPCASFRREVSLLFTTGETFCHPPLGLKPLCLPQPNAALKGRSSTLHRRDRAPLVRFSSLRSAGFFSSRLARAAASSQPGNRCYGWGLAPRHDRRPPRVAVTSPLTECSTHFTSIRERLSADVFLHLEDSNLSPFGLPEVSGVITTDRTSKLVFIGAHECVCFARSSNATRVKLGE